jgi:hypothetical protein
MNRLREAAQQALEALEATHYDVGSAEKQRLQVMDAITALRAALAQQEQEPVTTPPCKGMNCGAIDGRSHSLECHAEHSAAIAGGRFVPLPRREWRSLSEEEILVLYNTTPSSHAEMLEFARDIEAKLKEKNQ